MARSFNYGSALGVALLLCLIAAPVFGQTTQVTATTQTTEVVPNSLAITAFLGPGFGGGLQGNAFDFGVAAGFMWRDRLGFEGEFSYARQNGSGLIDTSSNTQEYSASVLYHFRYKTWLPYAAFGLGVVHGAANVVVPAESTEPLLDQSATDVGFNFGAGLKKRLNDTTQFRGDIRFFDTGADLSTFWRIYGGLTIVLRGRGK
jgi:Outer membrane protein beta-barrel domain